MKNLILNTLLFLLITVCHVNGAHLIPIKNNRDAKTYKKLVSSSHNETVISFSVNAYSFIKVTTPEGAALAVSIPEGTPILTKEAPDIGKLTQSIIIPDTDEMQIEVVSTDFVEIKDIVIAPSKGILYRNINPASVPYTYGNEYTRDSFFPSKTAELWKPYIARDFRGQTIVAYPLQYNPVRKILRIYTNITVRVSSTGNPGKINVFKRVKAQKNISCIYSKMYARCFINYYPSRYTPLPEKGSMLIISHGDFMDEMEPFIEWKKLKGIPTEIVDVADIGTSSSVIKDYISDYYDNNEDFTFLLLVGDYDQIPTSSTSSGDSDPAYGYISGSDSYPEIIVGRFSGETSEHIVTQVERSVAYEKTPEAGADWYHKTAGIASDDGSNPVDWAWMRDVRTDLLGYTYTDVDELYDGSQGGEDASGNPTASMVSDALNEGRSLFNYMGHGSTTSLSTSRFNVSDVDQLTNNNKLPFAWLGACLTGNMKNSTCFAEAGLRATNDGEPTGFIGVLAASISHPWVPPMHGMKEMNDILIESYEDNIKRTYGGLCVNGIMHMLDTQGSSGVRAADTWLIFGDPSLVVRTDTPEEMTVSHDVSIPPGATEFTVQCNTEDALISLTVEGEIIGTAYSNGANTIVPIDPPLNTTASTMQVTATAYNKIPYMADVVIGLTEITVSDSSDKSINKHFTAAPNPANNVNDNVYFTFTVKEPLKAVDLTIFDVVGNSIYEESQNFLSYRNVSLLYTLGPWDCTNQSGKKVSPGTYLALLKLASIDGTIEVLKTIIGIKEN